MTEFKPCPIGDCFSCKKYKTDAQKAQCATFYQLEYMTHLIEQNAELHENISNINERLAKLETEQEISIERAEDAGEPAIKLKLKNNGKT